MKENDSRILFNPDKLIKQPYPPIVIADGLRTPENVGSIVRLMANFGAEKLYLLNTEQLKESKIRKTACMARNYVKIINIPTSELPNVIPQDYTLVAIETSPQSTSIFSTPIPQKTALIVGSEVHGISADVLNLCRLHIHIPMTGPDTSMNVSHATCIALYEWAKQNAVGSSSIMP